MHCIEFAVHSFCSRGVLQALIEKQFPVGDRRKVADLFAVRDKMLGRSSPASRPGTPKKRKLQGQSVVLRATVQYNKHNLNMVRVKATSLCVNK